LAQKLKVGVIKKSFRDDFIPPQRKHKTNSGPYGSLFKASQKMVMLQLENILFPVVFVHLQAGFLCGEPRLGRLLFADEGGP
jgi:hypothetical protein